MLTPIFRAARAIPFWMIVLDDIEENGALVSAGRFPGNGFGRFVREGGRRVWQGI